MGECKIVAGREAPDVFAWERGDPDPSYFIVDDQYNAERYLYGEICKARAFSIAWLSDITATLGEFPGWGLGLQSIPDA